MRCRPRPLGLVGGGRDGYNARVRGWAVSLLLVVACAAETAVIAKPPAELILAVEDVPGALRLRQDRARSFDEIAEAFGPNGKAKLTELGFKGSHVREFLAETPSRESKGALGVFATVTLYGGAAGAKEGYGSNVANLRNADPPGAEVALPEALGDESAAYRFGTRTADGVDFSVFTVVFRVANASNAILVSGVAGAIDLDLAVALAKKQLAKQRP